VSFVLLVLPVAVVLLPLAKRLLFASFALFAAKAVVVVVLRGIG